ncbi:FunK1 protein kinase [Nannizzia gypsea CBS 118893]|uniref:non-specific serine/threonine protein kinase n=1 Tax=Arthroderma gypseum (strain ATCC MYA-4604 / CBS 118893) TaxID=535722 RepID=E5R2V5_ARTGP|nr:FunK1 protein kinase [Nannizzia gypsea CBS 118893]EFQ97876.1 FunK1 protein kinase [Nannizzia gypsea CBS 118893]
MVELSQEDRDIIAENPLDYSLVLLQGLLQEAEQAQDDSSAQDETRKRVIRRLLSTLQGEDAASKLRSRVSDQYVDSDLALLFRRYRQERFKYDRFRVLVQLILQKAAVLDLIATISRSTPPASDPPSLGGTPFTHSLASQQGSEQTRRLVEARVFDEIKHCTYRDVEGFFTKFFEGKDWTPRTTGIYQTIKERQVEGSWTDFPDPPVQAKVLQWWNEFQKEFLPEERGRFYTIKNPKNLAGSEAQRQIDLVVKRNDGQELSMDSDSVHNWKDVDVIGELKQSNYDKKGTLLQLGRYVRDVFSCQPTRRYIHAFTLCGSEMEAWVFDRSGSYGPGPFDIHDQPERFIQVIAGYTMMSEAELGRDTFTEWDADSCSISIDCGETRDMAKLQLLQDPITYQRAIVCRGTACFLTKTPNCRGYDCVSKFSWTSDQRRPEADLLELAASRGVKGIASVVGHQQITSITEMRSGMVFGKPYKFQSIPSALSPLSQSSSHLHGSSTTESQPRKRKSGDVGRKQSKQSRTSSLKSNKLKNEVTYDVEEAQSTSLFTAGKDGPYDNRIFRCLVVSPAGRALHRFKKISELLCALRDAVKAHRSLYLKGNILHRDISENNIIITDPQKTDGVTGMLIDLDLAKELSSGSSGARCRTGTMEFMAIECARHGWRFSGNPKGQPEDSLLIKWYTDTFRNIAGTKRGDMGVDGFEDILEEFPSSFECVKPLCREIRGILFPYKDGLFTGTPRNPEVLYEPTIRAFDQSIEDIKTTET